MAKKYTSVIGVDLGSQTIKVAEIKLQGRQPILTAIGMAQTPEGTVDQGGVHDSESIGAVVKDLCAASGISVGDAVVSITGNQSVLVRTLDVPNMNQDELKKHMEWEVTRNIPFAESTVVSDFKSFQPDDAAAQNMDVVMAIATQSSAVTLVNLLKRAGKKAAALDVEPLAIARSLDISYNGAFPGKQVCVVEIGHRTTSINIYKDGKLLMPRQVPMGGEMFTRAIADSMSLTFEDAERAKINDMVLPSQAQQAAFNPFGAAPAVSSYNPFADPTDSPAEETAAVEAAPEPAAEATNPYANAVAVTLDELVAEIRRSVDYHRSKGGEVDQVLLAGGASKMKNLDRFLSSALDLPVEMYDPFRSVTMSLKKSEPELVEQSKQDFAVAVGNALHICF